MSKLSPLDPELNAAIKHICYSLLPHGFDVADSAPSTHEELVTHLDGGGRMVAWSVGSQATIYASPSANYAFRAWHDWCHWRGRFPFTHQGERATCRMQCVHLLKWYGVSDKTNRWIRILDAEVVGQALYSHLHKRFPENQRAFVEGYLTDPQSALLWPLW